jgi:DNA-binding response OmpR family regulator
MKVLVVEDERKLGQFIRKGLEEAAYSVMLAPDCQRARDALCESEYDLIVLDLGLPDGSGLDLLREWRENKFAHHILILSARGSVEDRIKGLNLGADDYLGKPFSFDELLARVRSLARRNSRERTTVLQHGPIRMDLVNREVTLDGKSVYLTQREYALLEIFLQNIGRVLTRTQIAEKIWDCHFDMETNLIDVYVRKLRCKLNGDSLIATVRGVGYTMG